MNNNIRIFLGTLIAVIVLTVPLFLLPCDGVLITAYIFALIGVFALSATLLWGSNRESGEYVTTAAFPLAAAKYLTADILLSIVVVSLKTLDIYTFPAGWFFFLHILLAGLFAWKLLAMDAGKEEIEEVGIKVKTQTSVWKQFILDVSTLPALADPEVHKDIVSVHDALRYSDPMSDKRLENIENIIEEEIKKLFAAVQNRQNSEIPEICRQLQTTIKIRNEKCKSYK